VKKREEIPQSVRRDGNRCSKREKKSLRVYGGTGTVAAKVTTLQAIKTVSLKQIYWEKGAL